MKTTILALSGCASKSSEITGNNLSMGKYTNYSCEQIKHRVYTVNSELQTVSIEQDSTSSKDSIAMGVGLIVFAPAVLLIATGDDNEDKIANLKGEYNALRDEAYKKDCDFAVSMR